MICRTVLLCLCSLLLAWSRPEAAVAVQLQGRVFTSAGPLAGAVVTVYRDYRDYVAGRPLATAEPSGGDGRFSLAVRPGRYVVAATGETPAGPVRAFHPNNPLNLATDAWVPLLAVPVTEVRRTAGNGLVRGRVTFKGVPVASGYVSAYTPEMAPFKGLGVKTETLRADGSFVLALSPGEYVLVAKSFGDDRGLRPVDRGDLVGHLPANPVLVDGEHDLHVTIPLVVRGDRSGFTDAAVVYSGDLPTPDRLAGGHGLRGRVTDEAGRPLAGMYVLAYPTTEPVFQMFHLSHGTPYSARTGADGGYFLPLDRTGEYYLVARDRVGNLPRPGEVYGLYQGHPMHRVHFQAGEDRTGLDIVAGRAMTGGAGEGATGPAATAVRLVNPVYRQDTALEGDTHWAGIVSIQGVVSVPRGVTLTIEPGTQVRFVPLDRDHNGIGDSEIFVEGTIRAKGTASARILFTSAAEEPKRLDWSYINILGSSGKNRFAHCVFEYGFSGIQAHYCDLVVEHCLFLDNGEGLHYNTANLVAAYNTMRHNGVGIKFSRLEGTVDIHHNEITTNRIGIQFVRQHINSLDFDRLDVGDQLPRIHHNNIHANRRYNFSMGDQQDRSLRLSSNWWGANDYDAIAATIFDRADDPELGEVHFTPFLRSPMDLTGGGTPGETVMAPVAAGGGATGTLRGRVDPAVLATAGTQEAMVAFFNVAKGPPPTPGYRRVPDRICLLGDDHTFRQDLPAGDYYVGLVLGRRELSPAPPKEGERTLVLHGGDGRPQRFTVRAGQVTDGGDSLGGRVPQAPDLHDTFQVHGRVVGPGEEVHPEVFIFAFRAEDTAGRPAFVRRGTEPDGSFTLRLPAGATYHLRVRSTAGGGQPQPGELIGLYGDEAPWPVTGAAGAVVQGVSIPLVRVPQPGRSGSDRFQPSQGIGPPQLPAR